MKTSTSPSTAANGKAGVGSGSELIALDLIQPSKTNPRKRFDEVKLKELAESVKSHGVLEPILVRRVAACAAVRYEVVAGERRLRAAKLAGLTEIPALVRHLTDAAALEIQVIENEQRDDLEPLEKAAGYRLLIDKHGYTVKGLASAIGKSEATIYGVLKLLDLPKSAKEAIAKGELPSATAQLIARIPNAELRERATKEVIAVGYNGGIMSYRETLDHIQKNYMVELKGAPFNQEDANLLPSAGACTGCPKRSGNNRAAFPDGRADICTDPICYKTKCAAHGAAIVTGAKAEGTPVLEGKAAKGLPEAKVRGRVNARCLAAVAAAAERMAGGVVGWSQSVLVMLRALTAGLVADNSWSDVCRTVCRRRGLEGDHRTAIGLALKDMKHGQVLGLIAEIITARQLPSGLYSAGVDNDCKNLLAAFDVDWQQQKQLDAKARANLTGPERGKKQAAKLRKIHRA